MHVLLEVAKVISLTVFGFKCLNQLKNSKEPIKEGRKVQL